MCVCVRPCVATDLYIYIYMCVCVCVCMCVCVCIYQIPSYEQDATQGQFLDGV